MVLLPPTTEVITELHLPGSSCILSVERRGLAMDLTHTSPHKKHRKNTSPQGSSVMLPPPPRTPTGSPTENISSILFLHIPTSIVSLVGSLSAMGLDLCLDVEMGTVTCLEPLWWWRVGSEDFCRFQFPHDQEMIQDWSNWQERQVLLWIQWPYWLTLVFAFQPPSAPVTLVIYWGKDVSEDLSHLDLRLLVLK